MGISPRMLRYFAGQTRDPQAAFDLTAEAFAKAYEKRRDFRGTGHDQAAAAKRRGDPQVSHHEFDARPHG